MNNRFKILSILFLIFGAVYLNLEVLIRTIMGSLVGHGGLKMLSLAGWTSWWMFPIGGLIGIILGLLNEYKFIEKYTYMWTRCFIGTIFILLIEYWSGYILNIKLGLAIWDYSTEALNLNGQICLKFAVVWFFICPFAFWLDDRLRYIWNSDSNKKYPVWKAYVDLISLH